MLCVISEDIILKYYVLYNPLAANGQCEEKLAPLKELFSKDDAVYCNMTEISDLKEFLASLTEDDTLVICGGDGTLNAFINKADESFVKGDILYFASGSGNDFFHDIKEAEPGKPLQIRKYLKDLPYVTVNGKTYRFINGVGYGIDGYCCEVGDKLREQNPGKKINYAGIAIKGLLFHYHRTNATVIVDGKEYNYKKVWLAPTMNGRYYGGGMNMAPNQDRLNEERKLSIVVLHDSGKLGTLMVFPKIFEGAHTDRKKIVSIHEGHDITVKFDKPTALQIDGETLLGVTEYRAYSASLGKAE